MRNIDKKPKNASVLYWPTVVQKEVILSSAELYPSNIEASEDSLPKQRREVKWDQSKQIYFKKRYDKEINQKPWSWSKSLVGAFLSKAYDRLPNHVTEKSSIELSGIETLDDEEIRSKYLVQASSWVTSYSRTKSPEFDLSVPCGGYESSLSSFPSSEESTNCKYNSRNSFASSESLLEEQNPITKEEEPNGIPMMNIDSSISLIPDFEETTCRKYNSHNSFGSSKPIISEKQNLIMQIGEPNGKPTMNIDSSISLIPDFEESTCCKYNSRNSFGSSKQSTCRKYNSRNSFGSTKPIVSVSPKPSPITQIGEPNGKSIIHDNSSISLRVLFQRPNKDLSYLKSSKTSEILFPTSDLTLKNRFKVETTDEENFVNSWINQNDFSEADSFQFESLYTIPDKRKDTEKSKQTSGENLTSVLMEASDFDKNAVLGSGPPSTNLRYFSVSSHRIDPFEKNISAMPSKINTTIFKVKAGRIIDWNDFFLILHIILSTVAIIKIFCKFFPRFI